MNTLHTFSEKINERSAKVEWYIGKEKNGVILVNLDKSYQDSDIVSELIVIRKLLIEDNILKRESIFNAKGMNLNVSKGAIKKLLQGKSEKKEIEPFVKFIDMLLPGIEITVQKKRQLINKENVQEFNASTVNYINTHITIETPAIGSIDVTYHAVKRLEERIVAESGECKYPMQVLYNRITNPDLIKVDLPDNVIEHKQRKYRSENEVFEAWIHPTSTLNFAVVKDLDTETKTLVTVFIRKQS
jgi:hypothetical protein